MQSLFKLKAWSAELCYEACPMTSEICSNTCSTCQNDHHHTSNSTDLSNNSETPLPSVNNWRVVRGRWVAFNSHLITCRCREAPRGGSPHSHLGDGYVQIFLVGECSRIQFLRFLMLISQRNPNFLHLCPFIKTVRARRFSFHPIISSAADSPLPPWNCDGEALHLPSSVHCAIHRQAIQVFGSGPPSP